MDRKFGTIFEIGDCLVSEEVITEYFACDYEKCKGCCCIIGDSGAPLKEEEIEKSRKPILPFLLSCRKPAEKS